MINQFRGENFFLSNMYVVENELLTADEQYVPTSEHFYMSSRFKTKEDRVAVANVRAEDADKRVFADGLAAKTLAHELIKEGRPHFESSYQRFKIMHAAIFAKFVTNPELARRLVETGEERLVEGNSWGDRFWGVSPVENGKGNNYLGIILMNIREKIAEKAV